MILWKNDFWSVFIYYIVLSTSSNECIWMQCQAHLRFFPTLCDIQVKLEMTSMMWVEQLWAVQISEWMFSLPLKNNKVSLAGSTSFQGYFLGELWKCHDSVNTVVCDVVHLWNWAHIHMSFEPGLTADSHAKKWKASLSSQIWDTDHIL